MTEKHPEDMTAGELLRWAAENDKLRMRCDMCMKLYRMDGCGSHDCNDWLNDMDDKIEADLAKARRGGLERCAKSWAKANGWPEFRKGEGFGEWLERCFIPRPRFEDGEPVQFGDCNIDWNDTAECRHPGVQWNATAVDCDGMLLATAFGRIIAVAETDKRGRVKRTAPEVLGGDGLPIVEGDVVYELGKDEALTVYEVNAQYIHTKKENGAVWNNLTAEYLTHTPPDTQERIDSDAVSSSFAKYWGCSGIGCDECPASIDGKMPDDRYGTSGCREAMILDLLRRQRELDKRMGGE